MTSKLSIFGFSGVSLGVVFAGLFSLSVAFRDVYFGNVFQTLSFFGVVVLAFSICTVSFNAIAISNNRSQYVQMLKYWQDIVAVNVFTASAWLAYFFALTHLEPSIVNTLFSGIAPLTLIVLSRSGIYRRALPRTTWLEQLAQLGVLLSLLFLAVVTLRGLAGFNTASMTTQALGLVLALFSGVSITVAGLYSKRLHDAGISAESVLAVRFILLILVSAYALGLRADPSLIQLPTTMLVTLGLAATLLIVFPIYLGQLALVLTSVMTYTVVSALQPALLFVLQLVDPRISYSGYSLAGIITYSLMVMLGAAAHARGMRSQY
jgi:drug/metabolite transporter (DMT)-like permease